jgi:DNA mismatch endonuclease (patch repair protein)
VADIVSPEKRSEIMSKIWGKNTAPEMAVRRIAHRMGYRFRLHSAKLPGKPDLVFPRFRCVVFVNGCFWHWHTCREGKRTPKSNVGYWTEKRERNRRRDREVRGELRRLGWKVLVIWQCQRKDETRVSELLKKFLEKTGTSS